MKIFHLKTRLGFRLGSLLSALLVVICTIFTSGCFKGSADLTIREDGTSTLKTTILGADLVSSAVAEAKDEVMKSNPSATVKDVQEDDKKGFEIIAEYPDMRTLAEKGGKIFARVPGKGEGIQEKKTWFYDMYAFDLYVGAKEENNGDDSDPQMQAIMKGFLIRLNTTFICIFPSYRIKITPTAYRTAVKPFIGISPLRLPKMRISISASSIASGTSCISRFPPHSAGFSSSLPSFSLSF